MKGNTYGIIYATVSVRQKYARNKQKINCVPVQTQETLVEKEPELFNRSEMS